MTIHETRWLSQKAIIFSLLCCTYFPPVELLVYCKPLDNCSCKFNNGSVIDLEPLGKSSGSPRFGYEKAVTGNPDFEYAANICYGFTDHVCKKQVFCQRTSSEPITYFPIGSASTPPPVFFADGTGISYMGTYDGILRTSVLALQCDINGDQNSPTFIREGQQLKETEYHFTLKSVCACAGGCRRSESGLSFGSILCIIFSVLLVVYFVGGMLFMKFVRGAQGKELIPNVEVWSNLPRNIKEGCLFLVHGCKPSDDAYIRT